MTTRQPAPTLKLSESSVERPKVEFRVRRTVDEPDDNGEIRSVEQTSVELFQVKLHNELTLRDYEEIDRLQGAFRTLMEQRGEVEDAQWLFQLTYNYRRLMDVAFYDQVPSEAVYGLTLERLEQITDFLYEQWPESVRQRVAQLRAKAEANTPALTP